MKTLWAVVFVSTLRGTIGVEDPGFFKVNFGRTSFLGVEGALTYNDALVLKAMAESQCGDGREAMRSKASRHPRRPYPCPRKLKPRSQFYIFELHRGTPGMGNTFLWVRKRLLCS